MLDPFPLALSCPCYGSGVAGFAILIAVPAVLLVIGALLHHRRSARRHDPLTSDIEAARETPGAGTADGRR